MKTRNGWRTIAFAATIIVALGAAWTVIENYAPWAPRITLAIAAENKLARLDNQLITMLALLSQAQATNDKVGERRLLGLIAEKEREIKEIEALKKKHQ